jgi:tetratricopeptide (TPR) repeat protein
MLAVLLAGLLLSATPDAVEQARTDFERGAALYRAGNYREALSAFEEAQARSPAPQALFNIARCHDRLGEFVDAVEAYRAYLQAAPAAADRATVQARIDELQSRLPLQASLRVAVEPPAAVSVDDGAPQPSPVAVQLAPGHHRVSARRDGYGPVDRDVDLAPGSRVQLELSLAPLVAGSAPIRAPEAAVRDAVGATAPHRGERRWTWVATGLSAVSLAAGVTFGISAQQAQATLRDGTQRTQEQVQQIYDSAQARSTAANSFYIAAGVCGAAAVALFFLEPNFGSAPEGR